MLPLQYIFTVQAAKLSKMRLRYFFNGGLSAMCTVYIIICIIASVFAYQIMPDKSTNANNQLIELSVQKPGFTTLLIQQCPINSNTRHTLKSFFGGHAEECTYIPIREYTVDNNVIRYTTIDGIQDSCGVNTASYRAFVKEKRYLLGTDRYGRDVLSRLILGTRISITIGLMAVIVSLLIGVIIGSVAGYYGGRTDNFLMWFINVVWAIPSLLLVIAISFALGRGFRQIFMAIGLTLWVDVARMVRGQVMSIKEQEYVYAAKTLGYRPLRIIFRHILPNITHPLIVLSASNFASAILLEAGLSFLGIGVQPPMPSWGMMIKEGYPFLIMGNPYLSIIPGVAIMLLVLSFMVIGNTLSDKLNVKSVGKYR